MRKTKSAALAALAFALFMIIAGPAAAKDRNHDRIPDRWEKRHHLSLKVKQGKRDQDGDGLRNRGEFKAGLDPRDDDSDDDGVEDGDENAGTIESFDAATGKLTIKLFNGDSVSGLVTDDTEIECDADDSTAARPTTATTTASAATTTAAARVTATAATTTTGDDDDHGDDGDDDDEDCGTEALTTGREVEEADLKLADGKATFEEIELK